METREPEESLVDDQHVEIVDLPGYERAKAGKPRFQHTLRRLWQHRLVQVAGILVLVLFCLLALLNGAPGLRSFMLTNILGVNPTPTSMIGPNIDLFYVNAAPPWGVLSIDGKGLARLPDPAAGLPLRLGPGSHRLTWRAAPFPTQSCVISVPSLSTDTCLATETSQTPEQHLAWIVSFQNSMLTLPKGQQDALNARIQQKLDGLQASELVQPGEQFVETTASGDGPDPRVPIGAANQPLRATMHLTLDSAGEGNACTSGETVNICTINEERCGGLCTQGSQGTAWNVLAIVRTSWTYATLDGRVVAADMADAEGGASLIEHVLALTIRWDGANWHVQAAAQFFNGPIPCVAAADDGSISSNFGTTPFQAFEWRYIPAPNIAAGCLIALTSISNGGPSPTASSQLLYLHRFGMFIAVNRLAQEYNPYLPHPTPNELSLARELAALAHISIA